MTRTYAFTILVLVGLTAMFAVPARAQSDIMTDNYSIMVPERGYKPSRPLAGAEIQVAARDREARDHSEADERANAEHTSPSRFVRTSDRAHDA
jgi:hypothetical protein